MDKVRQRGILALDVGSGIINNIFLSKQLAVGIIDRNGLIDNFHSASVFIDDRSFNRVNGRFFSSTTMNAAFRLVSSTTMLETFVLFNRAVPIGVGKEPCHVSKVHNDKMCLAVLFSDTGSTTDDLLKGGHTLNRLVQDNQLCHFTVCSGGKQLRCSSDNWIRAGHGDEIVKFGFAINIGTGDSNTVVRIFLDHISVMVDEGNSHALGMIFGSAEHNGFLHPVGVFQIFSDLPCNLVNTVLENDAVVVVPVVVDAVFNLVAIDVGLTFVRSPSVTDVGRDIDNLERSKESVFDALL